MVDQPRLRKSVEIVARRLSAFAVTGSGKTARIQRKARPGLAIDRSTVDSQNRDK